MTSHNLLKGTTLIAGLTIISRLLGFLRDITVAAVFGAGLLTDAFFVALKIPNLLRSMVAEGALTSAFVPIFSQEQQKSKNYSATLFRNTTGLLICITILLTIIGVIYAPMLVSAFAPGFKSQPNSFQLCVQLTQIMFPFIIFISLVALINGALNSYAQYGAAPRAQIVMNCCLVIGALITIPIAKEIGIYILAWSVLISGVLQVAIQIPTLTKVGLTLLPARPFLQKHTKEILWLMLPAIFGAAVYQISMLINTMLASLLSAGSISWLFYADRLSQLPIGIIVVALGSVLLPSLSAAHAKSDTATFNKDLINSLRFSSFIIIPVATILIVLAEPICTLLFERGNFTAFDSQQTAAALKASALGLWGVSQSYLLVRALLATKDTVTPTIIGILTLILTIIISLALMGRPTMSGKENWLANLVLSFQDHLYINNFGHVALALSGGLATTLMLPLYFFFVSRRCQAAISIKPLVLLCSALIFTACLIYFTFQSFAITKGSNGLDLFWQTPLIMAIFYIFGRLLRLPELKELQSQLTTRIRRSTYKAD